MKTRRFLFALLILGMNFGNIQSQVLTGKVTDINTHQGLTFVLIGIHPTITTAQSKEVSTLTDESGSFRILDLPDGSYQLSASYLGYHSDYQTITIQRGEPTHLNIELTLALLPIGEVKVSSLRYEKMEREIAVPMVVIGGEQIPQQSSITLSDLLSSEPGVSLARDGIWSTSINIRGLGENRLIALVDGCRIETATDLAAGLSMMDPNEVDRMEVIKGAASSIYGTGAMGGVINIWSRQGNYSEKFSINGEAIGMFEGVNGLFGSHIILNSGSKRWKIRLSGGYRNAGDVRTPEGVVENTQFEDRNLNLRIGIKPTDNQELDLNLQHYQAFNVGIPGGAPFAPSAEATYPEERRQLASLRYSVQSITPVLEEVSIRAYHQFILRDVNLIPNIPPLISHLTRMTVDRIEPTGQHYTSGAVLETKWITSSKSKLVAGLEFWQRRLSTSRDKFIKQEMLDEFMNVQKTIQLVRSEKPIPDSRFSSYGIFLKHESTLLNDRLAMVIGFRTDGIGVQNDLALNPVRLLVNGVPAEPVPGQREIFGAQSTFGLSWSANTSFMYHLTHVMDLTLNLGRSFRSPSLEERFKYIDLGTKVKLGDPNLKPEKGWFADIGMRVWKDRFHFSVNGFTHLLTDMIVESPGEFIYRLTGDLGSELTDTLPALVNSNVDRAILWGGELGVDWKVFSQWVLYVKGSYVRGTNLLDGSDLPLIPPVNGRMGIRYQIPGIFYLEWSTMVVGAQNRIAVGETATKGYWLSDFSLHTYPKQLGLAQFQVFTGVNNVFNQSYENHLATNRGQIVIEPGRNIYIKLLMRF